MTADNIIDFQLDALDENSIQDIEKRVDIKAGCYPGIVLDLNLAKSGVGQAMFRISCAPLLDPNQPASAYMDLRGDHYVILPKIIDDELFKTAGADRIAQKQNIKAESVSDEMLAAYRKTLLRSGLNAMTNAMQAIMGFGVVPEIPHWNKGTPGVFFDHRGTKYTKADREGLKREAQVAASLCAADLTKGKLDVIGYSVLIEYEQREYNGEQSMGIKGLHAVAPAGVPTHVLANMLEE